MSKLANPLCRIWELSWGRGGGVKLRRVVNGGEVLFAVNTPEKRSYNYSDSSALNNVLYADDFKRVKNGNGSKFNQLF